MVAPIVRYSERSLFKRFTRLTLSSNLPSPPIRVSYSHESLRPVFQVEVVTDEDPPEVMETFEEGTFFGERNLVFTSPRDESFRAVTNVDVLVLTKEDVDSVLSCYEDVAAHVQSMASMLYPGLAIMKSK